MYEKLGGNMMGYLFGKLEEHEEVEKPLFYCENCMNESVVQQGFFKDFGYKLRCVNCGDVEAPSKIMQIIYRFWKGRKNVAKLNY